MYTPLCVRAPHQFSFEISFFNNGCPRKREKKTSNIFHRMNLTKKKIWARRHVQTNTCINKISLGLFLFNPESRHLTAFQCLHAHHAQCGWSVVFFSKNVVYFSMFFFNISFDSNEFTV